MELLQRAEATTNRKDAIYLIREADKERARMPSHSSSVPITLLHQTNQKN